MESGKSKIPNWFKPGLKFTAKWIGDGVNECELISFNEVSNLACVKIKVNGSEFTEDGWNLEHTIHGFERSDYTIKND